MMMDMIISRWQLLLERDEDGDDDDDNGDVGDYEQASAAPMERNGDDDACYAYAPAAWMPFPM